MADRMPYTARRTWLLQAIANEQGGRVDVLISDFVVDYAEHTGSKAAVQFFGAPRCPQLGADLAACTEKATSSARPSVSATVYPGRAFRSGFTAIGFPGLDKASQREPAWSKPMADQPFTTAQAIHTARVFLSECRARRHGHGFWFAFNAAQRARMRASAPAPLPAPPAFPARPVQQDLFV